MCCVKGFVFMLHSDRENHMSEYHAVSEKSVIDDTKSVRRLLSKLRQKWDHHTAASPMYLEDMLENDVTISAFCVSFLIAQRSRRVVRLRDTASASTRDESSLSDLTPLQDAKQE